MLEARFLLLRRKYGSQAIRVIRKIQKYRGREVRVTVAQSNWNRFQLLWIVANHIQFGIELFGDQSGSIADVQSDGG